MTSSLAQEQEQLRLKAAQELRTAREARASIIFSEFCTSSDRAQANADWYQAVRKAARDGVLTPAQIQQAADLSRQRYHQITHTPSATPSPPTSTIQLPAEDV